MKLLLDNTGVDVFQILPDSEKSEVEVVIADLRKLFKASWYRVVAWP